MKLIRSPKQLSRELSRLKVRGKHVGFVPTMGFLHEGHLSLVRKARRENQVVVVSIFVNPTQFGPREDFKRYPRNLKRDRTLLKREKVDFLFLPSTRAVYPVRFRGAIAPGPLAKYLCGPRRPGHFKGVVTVVNRLLDLVKPDRLYLGEKDYQQARIIEAMVKRLNSPVQVRTGGIVRDRDHVAMSSRNRYLSPKERVRARALYEALKLLKTQIRGGVVRADRLKQIARGRLRERVNQIDYLAVADPVTLKPKKRVGHRVLLALACYIGRTRLIDNMVVTR